MTSFKCKTIPKNKFNKKGTDTLDIKHNEYLKEFSKNDNEKIPLLKKERYELKNKMLENLKMSIEEKLELQDKIIEINNKIKDINSKKKEYYLNNSKYIFDYFENKKNIYPTSIKILLI